MDIFESTWHNFSAITLESSLIRVVIVPERGAKIVSLFDKTHQHEWLVPPMRPLKPTAYAAVFKDQDVSGWDEMMPTIDACTVDGVQLPDHGEVWSLPWIIESTTGGVVLSVSGVAMAYRLTRSASLIADNRLRLGYTLQNTGKTPLPYLWAAHPQFAAAPQTRIILPPDVSQMVNIIEKDPRWGESGTMHKWPQALARDGQMRRLDQVAPIESQSCRKFYIQPTQHIGWSQLAHLSLGCQLCLEWQPEDLPYLGIWVDEGMVNAKPVAALEPSNGYYDSLERAIGNDTATVLAPGEIRKWDLIVSLL